MAWMITASTLTARPGWGPHNLVLILPLLGAGLTVIIGTAAWRSARRGRTVLLLTPRQPALGHTLHVQVTFEKPPGTGLFTLTLVNEHVDRRGDDTVTRPVWQQALHVPITGNRVCGQFDLPVDARASEAETQRFVAWRFTLTWPDGESQDFPITVG